MRHTIVYRLFVFAIALLVLRIMLTGHFSFLFLIWNLFLAWIPHRISQLIRAESSRALGWPLCLLALLFLPNAPYIITDLFHLQKHLLAPIWLDTLLILSFSVCGLAFFVSSIQNIFVFLSTKVGNRHLFRILRLSVYISNGYGIYLGRNLRFNSWDLFSSPLELLKGIRQSFLDAQIYETAGITLTYSIFLYLFVELYKTMGAQFARNNNGIPERP